ncbi:hypothetical protein SY27_08075 [Flavobacterium sp. 316]|uniref:hypothetical protein n=1 Tax=Flavobacterium sp. 316 TaxID=1603293 RepID=UPI0005E46E8D|nr:hypothetical protein [Flavobacterium sp. 316]KIX21643.1 hypothetical protein SY27_08075 [Flavobacterium sp. 316]
MITPFGYVAIGVFLIAIFLTIKTVKRVKDTGCLAYGYNFLLIFSVISIFFSTSYTTLQSLNVYITGTSYIGKIVDYKSYEKEYKDKNDDYRIKTSTLYIPIIEFLDENNQKIQLESSAHSGDIPKIGETITISHNVGENFVLEHSLTTFLLLIAGFAFAVVFGFLTIGIIKYAFGYSMDSYKQQFVKGFFIGIKICLLLFTIAFILPIYNYLIGKSNMPLWAFAICVISFIGLTIVCYLFFIKNGRNLTISDKRKSKSVQ